MLAEELAPLEVAYFILPPFPGLAWRETPPPGRRGTCYPRGSAIVAEGENVDMQIALELPEDIAKRLELSGRMGSR